MKVVVGKKAEEVKRDAMPSLARATPAHPPTARPDDMDGEGEPRVDVCLDVAEATEAASITPSQQKKLRKMQEREELKPVQRQWQRQKKKERRLEARLAGKDLGREKREANAREKYVNSARVIIDLSFDDFMTDKVRAWRTIRR